MEMTGQIREAIQAIQAAQPAEMMGMMIPATQAMEAQTVTLATRAMEAQMAMGMDQKEMTTRAVTQMIPTTETPKIPLKQ
jgi:hypothetical protein